MTGLCWLASFPKSGNTWLRAMLTAAANPGRTVDLESLVGETRLDAIADLDDELAIDPTLLTIDELTEVRARFFRIVEQRTAARRFVKTHLMNVRTASGQPLFDHECGRAVYLVRDPLDVAVSYAHYVAEPYDVMAEKMGRENAVFNRPPTRRPYVLPQPMSSWRNHVLSWTDPPTLPLTVVRYEDMLDDPAGALAAVGEFVGLDLTADAIDEAVERTAFGTLKTQEEHRGFSERSWSAERFFRSGTAGQGRAVLSAQAIDRIRADAGDLLDRFGYR